MLQPVILCGGTGSRLWPLSRTNLPKPFIQLTGQGATLFQQTALRVKGGQFHPPLVICAESHRFHVLEQLAQLGIKPAAIILEPTARNTAAAIALAVSWAEENALQSSLVLMPADHLMGPPEEFQSALKAASESTKHHIVLFGITPTFANTEYGYIQSGKARAEGIFQVVAFHEKPSRARAEDMLAAGGYSWNSGIFCAHPILLMQEFQTHSPHVWQAVQAAWQAKTAENLLGTTLLRPADNFQAVPSEQFDTAVMEKTDKAVVMPFSGRWSDIGGWPALAEALPQDTHANTITGDVLVSETAGTFVHNSTPHKVIAVHGLDGAVIVDTPDALLVTTKARAAGIKQVFTALQAQKRPQANEHQRVFRPWGWYETIAQGPGFLVKRIGVHPGGRLSLQYHHHRAEHWVVVQGKATVTKGQEVFTLNPDESVYLPLGIHHRLENQTDNPLEIIEVQTGSILEESDIVRLDDVYNRTGTNT